MLLEISLNWRARESVSRCVRSRSEIPSSEKSVQDSLGRIAKKGISEQPCAGFVVRPTFNLSWHTDISIWYKHDRFRRLTHLMAIRVLIADNNVIIRSAIASTLKADPALDVVGEATNFSETLEWARALNPDIGLLDLHMPDESRYLPEIVKAPLLQNTGCILAISVWNDAEAVALSKKFGAVALLDKANLYADLISSIKLYCIKD
jgi:CheY-like chemotaxis protein